jgi:hypothetical protein
MSVRIAVIHLSERGSESLASIAKGLARGLGAQGHQISLIDAVLDGDARLSPYDFIAFGCESVSFMGKISARVVKFLAASGNLTGKRALAYLRKPAFFSQRACLALAAAMESQGMVLLDYQAFSKAAEAEAYAASLRLERR